MPANVPESGRTVPASPPVLPALAVTIAVLGLYTWLNPGQSHIFWDAKVYARAIADWRAHRDPYTDTEGLIFVYPPLVIAVAGFLAGLLPGVTGWILFLALHFAAILGTPYLLARCYFRKAWLTLPCIALFYVAEPSFASLLALRAGNIAGIVYAAALAAAVPGIRRNRWLWFYLVVFLGGLIKLPFLLLLFLPLFAGEAQWLASILAAAAAAASYPIERWLAPDLYRRFVAAARLQVATHADFGSGILGSAATAERKLLHRPVDLFPYAIQAVAIAAIFLALLYIRRKRGSSLPQPLWLGCLVVAVILCNPRLERYDCCIGLFAAAFVLAEALAVRRLLLLVAAIYLPSMLSLYVRHKSHQVDAWGTYETVVLAAALVAGLWHSLHSQKFRNPRHLRFPRNLSLGAPGAPPCSPHHLARLAGVQQCGCLE